MSTELALVRHATCALTASTLLGRSVDAPLDANGARQARALVARLGADEIALLQSSPALRARQTAAPLAQRLDTRVSIAAQLDEVEFGCWDGRSFAELQQDPAWRHWNEQRGMARTPAGDSLQQIQQRIVRHLTALAARFAGQRVVLFTHAELIRAALLHYLQLDSDAYLQLSIDPASITTLQVAGATTRVLCIAESVHV